MGKTSSYREALLESLKDPGEARAYLNAALEDSPEAFLKALKNVAQTNTMTRVAKAAGVQRETLYRSFSESGNPTWETLVGVVKAVGLSFKIVDPQNNNGPINSAISYQCRDVGAPTTFFELANTVTSVGNCLNPYILNGNNSTVVHGGNMTVTTTGLIPINASPLCAVHTGFTYGKVIAAANIKTSIEPTVFTASAATN
jgi:probable addiction module antidote protein